MLQKGEDGFAGIAPVARFPANGYGCCATLPLRDMDADNTR
jgi:hypothetical protein